MKDPTNFLFCVIDKKAVPLLIPIFFSVFMAKRCSSISNNGLENNLVSFVNMILENYNTFILIFWFLVYSWPLPNSGSSIIYSRNNNKIIKWIECKIDNRISMPLGYWTVSFNFSTFVNIENNKNVAYSRMVGNNRKSSVCNKKIRICRCWAEMNLLIVLVMLGWFSLNVSISRICCRKKRYA
jgi:hypothetical protein